MQESWIITYKKMTERILKNPDKILSIKDPIPCLLHNVPEFLLKERKCVLTGRGYWQEYGSDKDWQGYEFLEVCPQELMVAER
jgi:hypothetical protein